MAIAYPVASSSSVYYPSSSTTPSAYYDPASSVVYKPVTPVKSYSSSSYYDDDDDEYYTSVKKGVLTTTSAKYTTICKTATVSGKPVTYTTVYDLLNSCYPTVTVTKTVTPVYATPVAAIATTLPYKPVQSEYAVYGGPACDSYAAPAWLPKKNATLKPALSQNYTNGLSLLGTKNAPTYPEYVPGFGSGSPWGTNVTAYTSNPYKNIPDTGMTRKYKFVVSYQDIAPDGVTKKGLVVNGAFPGPTIEANWGDWIEVEVENKLPDEGTTIHWHGLLQKGTPWFDGVPSVSQCPVAPGKTLTYRFRADQFGTSWYHSHYSAQYAGGALGALIIHGPKHADYDEDLGPVILSDWYHKSYFDLVKDTMFSTTGRPDLSNNNLIQGKGNYPCANTTQPCVPGAGIAKFFFKAGKKYRLRLINTGSDGMQKFSIDGHKFSVIAQDFVPIKPYTTELITLGIGQRFDVVVEAIGKPKDTYWMRSQLGAGPTSCSLADGVSPNGMAAVYYDGADENSVPTSNSTITVAQIETCKNDALTLQEPLFPISSDPVGTLVTQQLDFDITNNGTAFVWIVNNQTFRGDYSESLLLDAKAGSLKPKPEWNVYDMGSNGTIRIVMYNHFPLASHPMHLHGHDFLILAEGSGTWDGVITNPKNPARRDTQILKQATLPASGPPIPSYVVIQFEADNPGVWPLHCHVAWHVSAGLYVNIVERPADIKSYNIPSAIPETCDNWSVFAKSNTVNQIDSGL